MSDHATKTYLPAATYDTFRNAALLYLPGVGTLYFAVAQIWGLPYAEQVVGTLAALTVFLGITVKKSKSNYNKSGDAPALVGTPDGEVVVTSHEDGDTLRLDVNSDLDELKSKDSITLLVKKESAPSQ